MQIIWLTNDSLRSSSNSYKIATSTKTPRQVPEMMKHACRALNQGTSTIFVCINMTQVLTSLCSKAQKSSLRATKQWAVTSRGKRWAPEQSAHASMMRADQALGREARATKQRAVTGRARQWLMAYKSSMAETLDILACASDKNANRKKIIIKTKIKNANHSSISILIWKLLTLDLTHGLIIVILKACLVHVIGPDNNQDQT